MSSHAARIQSSPFEMLRKLIADELHVAVLICGNEHQFPRSVARSGGAGSDEDVSKQSFSSLSHA